MSHPLTLLHFADAHIDMANFGRHDPETGLPMRVMDFLKSLDTIVDTAIQEKVDLVLFAGDAYKDRSPAPTFQREWGRRIMRLSRAGIPSLLLVGNHDLSPSSNRAHALDPFNTLEVPNVRVLDHPQFLGPDELFGLPLQVIALPWVNRSGVIARLDLTSHAAGNVYEAMQDRLSDLVQNWLSEANPELPILLLAHATVQGAKLGGERMIMLGADLVLPGSLVKDPRLDYTALGHIHRAQDLNEGAHPPVVYPGSIERVDFGEASEDKFFVITRIERGHTEVSWRRLEHIRPFIDLYVRLDSPDQVTDKLLKRLPSTKKMTGAILRLVLEYPREWENLIDEPALRRAAEPAFEFHLVKRPQIEARARLAGDQTIGSLTPLELLDLYWRSINTKTNDTETLNDLASRVIQAVHGVETENPEKSPSHT
jgi:DNA repair protein SbcD/Mre11